MSLETWGGAIELAAHHDYPDTLEILADLDTRGLKGEDALQELDRLFDDGVISKSQYNDLIAIFS